MNIEDLIGSIGKPIENEAEKKAVNVRNRILANPDVVNINPYQTFRLALDIALNPSAGGKKAIAEIWEYRRANASVYCQATADSAFTGLMDTLIYGEKVPTGLEENRVYLEKLFDVNAYARTRKDEGAPEFDNEVELREIAGMRHASGVAIDESISVYTDVLLAELALTLQNHSFQNIPMESVLKKADGQSL